MTTAAAKKPETDPEDVELEPGEILLDLDELAPRRAAVKLKGERYEIRTPQEFGVEDEQVYRAELGEYTQLIRSGLGITKAEKAKLRARLDFLFDKVLLASAEAKAEFNDRQRQQVVGLFSTALLNEDGAALEATMPADMKVALQRAREISSTMGN